MTTFNPSDKTVAKLMNTCTNIPKSGQPTIIVARAEYAGSIRARMMFCHTPRVAVSWLKLNSREEGKQV